MQAKESNPIKLQEGDAHRRGDRLGGSSAEGTRFAEIVNEMSRRLAKLGPSPLRMRREDMLEWVDRTTRQAEAELRS